MRVWVGVLAGLAFAAPPISSLAGGFATYQPIVVQAPLALPAGQRPCTVTLLRGARFERGEGPKHADYTPSCPGPWSKVVLTWRTRIAGRQYDRVGALWIGRTELYRFTTAEPTTHGIDYTVQKDVTEYAPMLNDAQPIVAELGNYTNATYTGVYVIDASLAFYQGEPPQTQADEIRPLENDLSERPWFTLQKPSDTAAATFADLPQNIEHLRLDVFSTQHGCDEFWYTNQPDAYAASHKQEQLCGGGAYREIDVTVDGTLAYVIYPFPWIYTGGINPALWRPIPAIDTFNIPPYPVDLDPFAGVFSDGKPHSISISVRNDRGNWPTDANLFIWRDPNALQTTGKITATSGEVEERPAKVRLTKNGDTFVTVADRSFSITGYVEGSQGRVTHSLSSEMSFSNVQSLDLVKGRQDATQFTTFVTLTKTTNSHGTTVRSVTSAYPLVANSAYARLPKNSRYDLMIAASVEQGRTVRARDGSCEQTIDATATYNRTKKYIDSELDGITTMKYRCSGSFGKFSIVKKAKHGVPIAR